ncbi:MAG: protein-export chaperone SecB [Pseudomonadota bacterium]
MSETTPDNNAAPNGAQNTPGGGAEAQQGLGLRVLAQYLKDLSFESPKAPAIFAQAQQQPAIAVNVDVNARAIGETQYEVELTVGAKASHDNETAFVVETTYAGAFEIVGAPREQIEPILLIECPRLLFPFLRQVLADTTQSGNFPPVMLDPIDFYAIYEQRRRQGTTNPDNVDFGAQNPNA